MTPEEIADDVARPRAPGFTLDPFQELNGRGLAAIHRLYLRDLSAVGALMGDIRAGLRQPGELAPAVRGMPMAQNLRLFGTACGASCRAITTHHQIKDFHLYPQLEVQGNEVLNAVLFRLRQEHRGLEHLIEVLAEAADALATDPSPARFDACAERFAALDRAVRSHFRYEEDEIGPAIGYYGVRV
ncbi:hemerythrin domain-containing protein [Paracoccus sp. MC1854]|uniref:hemerythrin domain-containing protein n=1 Tax=Paracoccus sp. MC1854 TaxID=2760306 RepID=UPI001603A8A3|nr:hemerythrin domain-containing protein [Paracoccus sp. MC1854]MBB1492418.1 hemerythrin domain-containing protein [Paracoccus sp. MC1854]